MPLNFEKFLLIFPPRPSNAINPAAVNQFPGFIGQYKYNDTRNLIYIFPDGHIELYNRHKERHLTYKPTKNMLQSIKSLNFPLCRFHVLDSGLMHNKTRNIKDRIILWDILVFNGKYLIGTTYNWRYELLRKLVGDPTEPEDETGHRIALRINRNLWLAPIFTENLDAKYKQLLHMDEIEGLVLKDPNGKLEWGIRPENNGSWQIRVRKPNPNYSF
ncbi:MAG: hypothetical protein A3K03_00390 [Bdellovibrionales bacterium RIFOXYD1_FULL_44_7]|nr:MAG: hypothetical protein A3K03_00390 [Bdellovibrionales bacterium RIFOXYD1_FULL_44_7]